DVDGVAVAGVHRDGGDAAAHAGQRPAGGSVDLTIRDGRGPERPPDPDVAFVLVRVIVVGPGEGEAAADGVGGDRRRGVGPLLEEPGVERVALADALLAEGLSEGGLLVLHLILLHNRTASPGEEHVSVTLW